MKGRFPKNIIFDTMETEENGIMNDQPEGETKPEENPEQLLSEAEQAPIQAGWKGLIYQVLFLLGGILFFVIINYIFGFMKGN